MRKNQRTDNKKHTVTEIEEMDSDIQPADLENIDNANEENSDRNLRLTKLEDRDEDGELLNEASSATDQSGRDLDVPGAEADDDNEDIGEEDEENNEYSFSDQ